MRVNSWEEGERPTLWTRARTQAPAAKKVLVNVLSESDWADLGYVIVDWRGLIAHVDHAGQSIDGPALDKSSPVMYIQVIKLMPQLGGSAVAEHRLYIDDVFGGTDITADDLLELVVSLKESINEQVKSRQEVSL